MYSAKDRYTLIEQSSNSKITCMQYSQKNFMRIIGNDQKNNGQNFWEILERIIGNKNFEHNRCRPRHKLGLFTQNIYLIISHYGTYLLYCL